MKSKIFKRYLCTLLVLVIFVMPSINIYAASYSVNVTKYAQEKTNWCWVACVLK